MTAITKRLVTATMAAAALATALLACGNGRIPECRPAHADTAGWREVTSRYRRFAVTLPPTAREDSVWCIDSMCGIIHVGDWSLRYDMGPMAGPGDSLRSDPGAKDEHICALTLAGRPAHLKSARMDGRPHGRDRIAAAALPLGEEGGLYFFADSLSERGAAEFVAAVRSLRLIPWEMSKPGGR